MDPDVPVPWLCERCYGPIPPTERPVTEQRVDPSTGGVLWARYHREHAPKHLLRDA